MRPALFEQSPQLAEAGFSQQCEALWEGMSFDDRAPFRQQPAVLENQAQVPAVGEPDEPRPPAGPPPPAADWP